jgi:hypothetical protein
MEVSGKPRAPVTLPSGNDPGAHWIGGLVDPRAGQDSVAKTKTPSLPLPGIETL